MTPPSPLLPRNASLRPWQVVLGLSLLYLAAVFIGNGLDPKAFVTIGNCYSHCTGFKGCAEGTTNGYDGQFFYYIARDLANAAPCLDVPAYRYQRILLPLLGRMLGLGNPDLIPLAFVVINLVALVVSVAALEDLLRAEKVSRWYALVYGLFLGVFMSVRLSTSEPLAYGLVVLSFWLAKRDQDGLQAVVLLLAAFAKETTLVVVAGYVLYDLLGRRYTYALGLALFVGLPFAVWQIVLYLGLGAFGAGSGGAGNSPFEIIPFNGYWRIAYDPTGSLRAFLVISLYLFPAVILPSLWGIWVALRDLRRGEYDLYTCQLLVNAAVMATVPFSTYREPLGIYRFMPGLVISFLLYAAMRCPRGRPLRYSPLWLMLLYYLTAG